MLLKDITISSLTSHEWMYYKQIMTEAVENEPASFTSIPEYLQQLPKGKWMESLESPVKKNFIARKGILPIGIVSASWGQENTPPNEARINALYVQKRLRCKGIGSLLLKNVISYLQQTDNTTITLLVNSQNHKARKFYQYHNFSAIDQTIQIMSNGIEYKTKIMKYIL